MERDDAMMEWFRTLAAEIRSLDLGDTNVTGRKISSIIKVRAVWVTRGLPVRSCG